MNDINTTERDLIEAPAIRHNYDTRGAGATMMQYLLDREANSWIRLDQVPGALVLQTAADLQGSPAKHRAEDRRSETRVALDLKPGDIVASVEGSALTKIREVTNRGADFDELIEVPFHEAGDIRLENVAGEVLPPVCP